MSVGILIFVISVIISIITTMRENSHKDRQNQKPPQKHLPIMNQKRWLFEEIERTFKEISEELNEGEERNHRDENTMIRYHLYSMNFQRKSLNRNLL